jgi:hypothetical protein
LHLRQRYHELTKSRNKVAHSQTTHDTFQDATATTLSELTRQVEAIALAIDSLSISGVEITQQDVEVVKRKLDEHCLLLKQRLLFCTNAMDAAHTSTSGTHVKYAKANDHARQTIGNFGAIKADAPEVVVDSAEASERASQSVGYTDLTGLNQETLNFLAGK